jgi:hypothetical protein
MAGDGVLKASELRTKTKLDLEKQAVCCYYAAHSPPPPAPQVAPRARD